MAISPAPTPLGRRAYLGDAFLLRRDDASTEAVGKTDHAGEIAGKQAEIDELTSRIEELRADCARSLAAIVADGVTEAQAAEMTGRELREVKAAVKATVGEKARVVKKPSAARSAASSAPAAA